MKKFFDDLKRYKNYMFYATKANLKAEVANSYLSWLWWILDPLLFMLVYTFVALVVFGKGEPYFPVFVFIGTNSWNLFSKSINKSVKIVRSNKSTISKVYIPKYVLVLVAMMENCFKTAVAFTLIAVMIPIYRVPLSWCIFQVIPIFFVLLIFTFGCCCLVLHVGVYVADFSKIVPVLLKLLFYMTGIFYNLTKRVPEPYGTYLLRINPMAFLIKGLRDSLLYSNVIDYRILLAIFIVGIVLSMIGVRIITKHENNYVKVI